MPSLQDNRCLRDHALSLLLVSGHDEARMEAVGESGFGRDRRGPAAGGGDGFVSSEDDFVIQNVWCSDESTVIRIYVADRLRATVGGARIATKKGKDLVQPMVIGVRLPFHVTAQKNVGHPVRVILSGLLRRPT